MAYEITLPDGSTVRTDELLVEEVIDIAKAHQTQWAHVVDLPVVGDGAVMFDLYKRQCARRDLPVPTALTATKLASFYRQILPGTAEDPSRRDDRDGADQDPGDQAVDPPTVDAPAST